MDLDPLASLLIYMAVLLVLLVPIVLLRKRIPGVRGMVDFNTAPPFRAWGARVHPDAAVPVQVGSRVASGDDDPAHATVIVRIGWGNYPGKNEGPGWKQARPLTPVVYVDGVPAASGWGTVRLTLTPGPHLVAVTGGYSGCYKLLELDRGERRELDYRCVIGGNADGYSEGFPGVRVGTYLVARSRGLRGGDRIARVVYGAVALALLLILVVFLLPDDFPVGTDTLMLLPVLVVPVVAGVGIAIAAMVQGFRSGRTVVAAAPAHGAPQQVRILDDDDPEKLVPAPGWSALALRLRFRLDRHAPEAIAALAGGKQSLVRRWRTIRVGEPELPACRPWVPAPIVTIDGRPLDVGWTRSWLQLPPGEYDVHVRIPAPESRIGPQTRVDLSRAEWRRRVVLTAGRNREVDLLADVTATPGPDRPELAVYRVRL